MQLKPDALVLFSGGLDSLLTAKLLEKQGFAILCLHFHSSFFGAPRKIEHWRKIYNLNIKAIDASKQFVEMLAASPRHGFGKTLNPCIDCKIELLKLARKELAASGASFIATGEVLGQRPMSQRKDALHIIAKESDTNGLLLRPLSGQLLAETIAEQNGVVKRENMLRISGRSRESQLRLAHELGITEIPAPGGGCLLTEKENTRRYWLILKAFWDRPVLRIDELIDDFYLANQGRMAFKKGADNWLVTGKNQRDNEAILAHIQPEDLLLRLPFPGPLAALRRGSQWDEQTIFEAGSILASYSSRAVATGAPIKISIKGKNILREIEVKPERFGETWDLPTWEATQAEIKVWRKSRLALYLEGK